MDKRRRILREPHKFHNFDVLVHLILNIYPYHHIPHQTPQKALIEALSFYKYIEFTFTLRTRGFLDCASLRSEWHKKYARIRQITCIITLGQRVFYTLGLGDFLTIYQKKSLRNFVGTPYRSDRGCVNLLGPGDFSTTLEMTRYSKWHVIYIVIPSGTKRSRGIPRFK